MVGRKLPRAQSESDVFTHRHIRKNRIVLKHHTDIALTGIDIVYLPVVKINFTAFNAVETGDHPQKRRFTAAGRTEQRKQFSVVNLDRKVGDNDAAVFKLFQRILHRNRYTHCSPP